MTPLLVTVRTQHFSSRLLPRISSETISLAVERLSKLSFFSERDYSQLHPEVAGSGESGAAHAICFGSTEGRELFKREQVARALGATLRTQEFDLPAIPESFDFAACFEAFAHRWPAVSVYVSSLGNIFMKEIAHDLATDLRRAGIAVTIRDESAEKPSGSEISIVVAPHEFFVLGQGPEWLSDEMIRRSFVYNTEQLQTRWFARCVPAILSARGIFDISAQAAELFRSAQIPALHLEPGAEIRRAWLQGSDIDHPLIRVLPESARHAPFSDEWSDRHIDVSFFGSESPRREAFFGRNAKRLAQFQNFLYYRRNGRGPIREASDERSLTRIAGHVSGHSKISLNIHRDEFAYFEWHRMVRQGMASGALVVSDTCLPHPHLKPAKHFLQEDARQIPNLLEWLLREKEGLEKADEVRANARALLEDANNNFIRTLQIIQFLSNNLA